MGENEKNWYVAVAVSSQKDGLFSSVTKEEPEARSINNHRYNKRLGNKTRSKGLRNWDELF